MSGRGVVVSLMGALASVGLVVLVPAGSAAGAAAPVDDDLLLATFEGIRPLTGAGQKGALIGTVDYRDSAVDPEGDLWVTREDEGGVFIIPADGSPTVRLDWGNREGWGLAFDADGEAVIAGGDGLFREDGDPATPPQRFTSGANRIVGVSLASDGDILYADAEDRSVNRVSPAGVVTPIAPDYPFSFPSDVVEAVDGSLIVSGGNSEILQISTAGDVSVLAELGQQNYGLAVGDSGTIYASGLESDPDSGVRGRVAAIDPMDGTATELPAQLPFGTGLSEGEFGVGSGTQDEATTTTVTTTPDGAVATVTGSGTAAPTGTVTFLVDGDEFGTAELSPVEGQDSTATATLDQPIEASTDRTVTADYPGDTGFAESSDTYERTNPAITAEIVTNERPNAAGWYNEPVEIKFTCEVGSALLSSGCPTPVTRRNTDPDKVFSRTITATDGGADTVQVPIKVDARGPVLTVRRVGEPVYARNARPIRCGAVDGRSGVNGSCKVTYSGIVRGRNGAAIRSWTARASDVAGNTSSQSGRFLVTGPAPRT